MIRVELSNFDSRTLSKLVHWLGHYRGTSLHKREHLSVWDRAFFKHLEGPMFHQILKAAEILEIKGLARKGCQFMRERSRDATRMEEVKTGEKRKLVATGFDLTNGA